MCTFSENRVSRKVRALRYRRVARALVSIYTEQGNTDPISPSPPQPLPLPGPAYLWQRALSRSCSTGCSQLGAPQGDQGDEQMVYSRAVYLAAHTCKGDSCVAAMGLHCHLQSCPGQSEQHPFQADSLQAWQSKPPRVSMSLS